jgi:uncharacterized protein (DUF1800 family)
MRKTLTFAGMLCCTVMLPARTAPKPPAHNSFEKKLPKNQQVLQALNRLTFGPRPGDVQAIKKLGLKKWIDLQLHPGRIAESKELEARLETLKSLHMTQAELVTAYPPRQLIQALDKRPIVAALAGFGPKRRREMLQSGAPPQALLADLSQAKIYRAIYSNRQLQEELVDFWFNHFNVFFQKGADRYLLTAYERDAIRPHVLGKFRDLLEATAKSPAMLFYLDNWQSVSPDARRPLLNRLRGNQAARGLNENYGRELMELHTLGVNGGYTQQDVIEVARCFTGWSINRPLQDGAFVFRPRMHDQGQKVVLGVIIPAGGGIEDGEKVLDILARSPATAQHISKELAQRFVADDPPPALVNHMAKTFLATDGDLRAVMETMIDSREFFSQGAWRAKVKTPLETVVSAVRATGAQVGSAMPLANQIAALGEPLYRKLEPTGYSNANTEWINSSALLARMNFGLALGENRLPGITLDAARFPGTPEEIARQLLLTGASKTTLDAIGKAVEARPRPPNAGFLAGLIVGSPDFQRR